MCTNLTISRWTLWMFVVLILKNWYEEKVHKASTRNSEHIVCSPLSKIELVMNPDGRKKVSYLLKFEICDPLNRFLGIVQLDFFLFDILHFEGLKGSFGDSAFSPGHYCSVAYHLKWCTFDEIEPSPCLLFLHTQTHTSLIIGWIECESNWFIHFYMLWENFFSGSMASKHFFIRFAR